MLSDIIFPIIFYLLHHSLCYNGQFTISCVALAVKLLKSHQIETKNLKNLYLHLKIYYKSSVYKLLCDVILQSFPRLLSAIPCFILTNLQLDGYLQQKILFKSHQIKTKKLLLHLNNFYKIFVLSCCVLSFSNCCLANLALSLLRWKTFISMTTFGSYTSQTTSN